MRKLSKLEVAAAQLDTAIRLWFSETDTISAHSLACAAHQIIHDVNKNRGGDALLFDSPVFRDEHRKDVVNHLSREYNFFKHADRDHDSEIEFDDARTEKFLFLCSWALERFGLQMTEMRRAINIYFTIHHPELLTDKGSAHFFDLLSSDTIDEVRAAPRKKFFEGLEAVRQFRTNTEQGVGLKGFQP